MQLKSLSLSQVRAFEHAEFTFQPGMNLLVGVNGVGKSTVLDTLRILLSHIMPKLSASKSRTLTFGENDIKIGQDALTAELQFELNGLSFDFLAHQPRDEYGAISSQVVQPAPHLDRRQRVQRRRETKEGFKNAERYGFLLTDSRLPSSLKTATNQSFALFFSTRRSLPSMTAPSKTGMSGQAAAFVEALTPRELRLREFAEWWLVQEALAKESGKMRFGRNQEVLSETLARFLDSCSNLRAVREPEVTLLVDKEGTTLDVRQLSDGERNMIALVLDLARRLAQANPKLDDPIRDGKAIVLIDELDLHLHPRWQRTIVEKLTRTFPNCQFIATTHSPQIIGEVAPESIILLENGQPPLRPDQSLGMDSNWVLRYLMGVDERNPETKQELRRIADLIENEAYDNATEAIDVLRNRLGEFPKLVRLQTRIDRIQLLGE